MQQPEQVRAELARRGPLAELMERFKAAPPGVQALGGVIALVLVGGVAALGLSLGDDEAAGVAIDESPDAVADGSDVEAPAEGDGAAVDAEADGENGTDASDEDAERDGSGEAARADTGEAASSETGGDAASGGNGGGGEQRPVAAGCEGVQLTATDRGVTEDEILIGVLVPNLGPLADAGFDVGVDVDHDPIMEAWLEELNRDGGVACRQVREVRVDFDVLSVETMQQACRELAQDHEVFAVVTSGGYDSVAQRCLAEDHRTPFINPDAQPEGWYEAGAPYLWSTFMNKDRMHRNHMRWLAESGTIEMADGPLDDGHTVGVIYHGIPNVGPSVEDALLPELDRLGVEPAEVIRLSSDDEQALAQINSAVLQMRSTGVDFVIFPMNLIFKTQFMQVAESQGYFPEYTDSDHYFGCMDFVTATYPADSFDGTTCVTATVAGMQEEQLMQRPAQREYREYGQAVFERTNAGGYESDGRNEEQAEAMEAIHLSLGTMLLLWAEAADRVDPEQLTRQAWGHEMGQTGHFDKTIVSPYLTYAQDKWDGPDELAIVRWFADAGDGYDARMFRQIRDFFSAFF